MTTLLVAFLATGDTPGTSASEAVYSLRTTKSRDRAFVPQ